MSIQIGISKIRPNLTPKWISPPRSRAAAIAVASAVCGPDQSLTHEVKNSLSGFRQNKRTLQKQAQHSFVVHRQFSFAFVFKYCIFFSWCYYTIECFCKFSLNILPTNIDMVVYKGTGHSQNWANSIRDWVYFTYVDFEIDIC